MATQTFCISAGHPLAAGIARDVLQDGGNAVDAGVAAAIALSVLHCEQVQLGGIAPMILRMAADGRTRVIDGVGRWPARTDAEVFRSTHRGRIPPGVLRTVVPGAPAAWITALRHFGTRGLAELIAPSVRLAAEGFPVHAEMATVVAGLRRFFHSYPENQRLWLPGGEPPAEGTMIRFPELAATLEALAAADRAGAAAGGREAGLSAAEALFYRGEIAEMMICHVADVGGWLDREDLAGHRCRIEEPLATRIFGGTLHACGPWSQGPALAQALAIFEAAGVWRGEAGDPAARLHAIAQALDLALADREAFYGDPDFVEVPLAALLSAEAVARRAAGIAPLQAFGALPEPSLPGGFVPPRPARSNRTGESDIARDTSVIAVADVAGNVFCATPSDAAADAPAVPGLGFVISTRGSQSHAEAGHPAAAAPGRRPRVTACPTLHVADDGRVLCGGGPGGDRQLMAMAQVLALHLGTGADLATAVAAPRVFPQSAPQSTSPHLAFPGLLLVEEGLDQAAVAGLAARGHRIKTVPATGLGVPSLCLVATGPGGAEAVGDPRRDSGQVIGPEEPAA